MFVLEEMGVNINLRIGRKQMYFAAGLILLVVGINLTLAAYANPTSGVGHDFSELQKCSNGQVLKMVSGDWACASSGGTDTNAGTMCVSGEYLDGDGTCNNARDTVLLVKTTSSQIYNSDTLKLDDDLQFTVQPGETWQFEIVALAKAGSGPDIQFALKGKQRTGIGAISHAMSTLTWGKNEVGGDSVGSYIFIRTGWSGFENPIYKNFDALVWVKFESTGLISVPVGQPAQVLGLQWAQRTARTELIDLREGSYLYARRVS